jgi:GTP diphosphokinase / guanosine-3',5'-bis(diphosphate) 3'-diphosphatase
MRRRSKSLPEHWQQRWLQFLTVANDRDQNRELLGEYFFSHVLLSPGRLALFLRLLKKHVRTLRSEAERRSIAAKYLDVLSPVCERFGLFEEKERMDSYCFQIIDPEAYRQAETLLSAYRTKSKKTVASVIKRLHTLLNEHGVRHQIQGRYKNVYSVYRKLQKKRRYTNALSLQDIFAFRIIVTGAHTEQCYEVLNLLHDQFYPIADSFKDYISIPKINGYQSIHTILNRVVTGLNLPAEVQIRTQAMHDFAEHGLASHWLYASNKRSKVLTQKERKLVDHFISMSKSVYKEHAVFCVSPKGDVYKMPSGSTVRDFAYQIHTTLGQKARGALINGKSGALGSRIQDGDRIAILKDDPTLAQSANSVLRSSIRR